MVYKVKDKETGVYYAMKKMKLGNEDEGVPSQSLREISLLKELNGHPNIIKLVDLKYRPPELQLMFEYVNSDLRDFVKKLKPE